MKRSPKVFGSSIDDSSVLNENFNKGDMALTCSYMERSPSVSVSAVYAELGSCSVLVLQYFERCKFISDLNCKPQLSSDVSEILLGGSVTHSGNVLVVELFIVPHIFIIRVVVVLLPFFLVFVFLVFIVILVI